MTEIRPSLFVFPAVFMALIITGCVTQYDIITGKDEIILISEEREVKLGRSISKQVEKKFELVKDEEVNKRVKKIGYALAEVCGRRNLSYNFFVLDEEEMNAFAIPGGYVYVTKGMIGNVDSDDELACVIAHEIGHIVAKHSIKKLQKSLGYSMLNLIIDRSDTTKVSQKNIVIALSQLMMQYSREDELVADKLAVRYLNKSNFDSEKMITLLEKLRDRMFKKPIRRKGIFRSHPYISERIAQANALIYGQMDFVDYINVTEE